MSAPEFLPEPGDLVWTDFDPTVGRRSLPPGLDPGVAGDDEAGRRPALVVSPAAFALNTGFVIVCPITSGIHPFPTSVVLPDGLPVSGEILLSHLRSVDALARPVRPVGASIPPHTAAEVRAKLATLIAI